MELAPAKPEADVILQPDLLEAFAEREVSIFGIQGTFRQLAEMCPVDLSDARVSVEAKNDFVVKAANEAGLAIEPEFAPVFERIATKHQLERNYTVEKPKVETMQETPDKPERIEITAAEAEVDQRINKEIQDVPLDSARLYKNDAMQPFTEAESLTDEPSALVEEDRVDEPEDIIQQAIPLEEIHFAEREGESIPTVDESTTIDGLVADQIAPPSAEQATLSIVDDDPVEMNFDLPDVTSDEPVSEEISVLTSDTDDVFVAEPLNDSVEISISVTIGKVDDTPELGKIPVQLATSIFESAPAESNPPAQIAFELPAPYTQIEVAIERLDLALAEQSEEMPTEVREILDKIEALVVTRTEMKMPSTEIEPKLAELMTELFDELNIDYTPELIESFVALVLARELEPQFDDYATKLASGNAPEDFGTHEFLQKIKSRFGSFGNSLFRLSGIGSSALKSYSLSGILPVAA